MSRREGHEKGEGGPCTCKGFVACGQQQDVDRHQSSEKYDIRNFRNVGGWTLTLTAAQLMSGFLYRNLEGGRRTGNGGGRMDTGRAGARGGVNLLIKTFVVLCSAATSAPINECLFMPRSVG